MEDLQRFTALMEANQDLVDTAKSPVELHARLEPVIKNLEEAGRLRIYDEPEQQRLSWFFSEQLGLLRRLAKDEPTIDLPSLVNLTCVNCHNQFKESRKGTKQK